MLLWMLACTGVVETDADTDTDTDTDVADADTDTDTDEPFVSPYAGGWPFNPDKEALQDPGLGRTIAVGDQVGNFTAVDQFGESVQLYDFAGHGKPVMLDISAEWCLPCQDIGVWLEGGDEFQTEFLAGFGQYDAVRDAVDAGDLYWITILAQDGSGRPADATSVQRWSTNYPHDRIPVLADDTGAMMFHLDLGFFPSIFLVDSDMTLIEVPGNADINPPMRAAADRL